MRKEVSVLGVAAAVLAVTAMPAGAGARPGQDPTHVVVTVAELHGSGCPPKSVDARYISDIRQLEVRYSAYTVQAGGSSSPTDMRKNCEVTLLVYAQGFTYAVTRVDNRGYADLQKGASALHKGTFYFQGASDRTMITHKLTDASTGLWGFTDTPAQIGWQACGEKRYLRLFTELSVDAGTSQPTKISVNSMDDTDSGIRTSYHLAWKSCR
ncbi:DUF4360 domain-containing protein [Actinomadura litoris]|uniref:DUF4360 domain-containing protein n=1 Tax=Actinomadura litoris TaxID=2678616 RepID=UPI001FA7C612|nr:DUF4360 domain-containing protein [Actinomadura litoris]